MTTWTLSELGCTGDCQQGKTPCTCQEPVPFAGWLRHEPVVIVESGASVPHKPQPLTHDQADQLLAAYGGSFALIRAVEKAHNIL